MRTLNRLLFAVLVAIFPMASCLAQWTDAELEPARAFYAELDSGGLMVMHRGQVVVSWGDVTQRYNVASIRKALLNSLYGIAYDRGWINLQSTLSELGIDDTDPPLTDQEKTATVEDLLHSRSGIFHPSVYEAGWLEYMPERGLYKPGEYWVYNNWDFNALGTIFEQQTGNSIHAAFDAYIAQAIGMQDFRPQDVEYETRRNLAERMRGNTSDHRLYLFKMSTRDLARFGQLILQRGQWNGEVILSQDWIQRTMTAIPTNYPVPQFDTGYGYLWWVESGEHRRVNVPSVKSTVWMATGNRGHNLYVVPQCDLVIAHTAPTTGGAGALSQIARRFFGAEGVSDDELGRLYELLISSQSDLHC